MIGRRWRVPDDLREAWEGFERCVAPLERAKEHLMAAVPSGRAPGVPLAEGLAGFEEGLLEVRDAMPGWRDPRVEPEWQACRAGLEAALEAASALRLGAPTLGFESLLGTVGDLIAPLEAFGDALERFRSLTAR